ncbi:MAG: glycosyltransferase family 9 protein [Chthoniobacterales bacterium]
MNILLLQLKRIGDLVLTTPAIAAVRKKFPEANISLIVSSAARELLPAIPGLDQSFVASGRIRDASKWFTVARRKCESCVDFTHSDSSAFLTLLSGARLRVTSEHVQRQSRMRALSYNRLANSSLRDQHTVDHYLALLDPLGIRDAAPTLQLALPPVALAQADHVLAGNKITGDFLLFHPGSARTEKFWEPDRWSELLAFAASKGLPCLITGGPSALEQTHIAKIRATARIPFIDLSSHIDLLTLAALIEKARLLVTVDSAPMHLAAATQTPQVVLFGPTNPLHWRPRFAPAVILQAGQPAPLTVFTPEQKRAPMNLISTRHVIDGMEALLATPRGAPYERT